VDNQFRKMFVQNVNILSTSITGSFTVNNKPSIQCSQHGLRDAFKLEMFGLIKRDVCPLCFVERFPEMEAPITHSEDFQAEPVYMCSDETCMSSTDYHHKCIGCGQHFCEDHLSDGWICFDCLKDWEHNYEGCTRGS